MISISLDSLISGLIQLLLEAAIRSLGLACLVALALTLFRVKGAKLRLSVWTGVLYAALAMPLLSRLLPAVPLHLGRFFERQLDPAQLEPRFDLFASRLPAKLTSESARQAVPKDIQAPVRTLVSWHMVAAAIYLPATGLLLARLGLGWLMSLKLRWSSRVIADSHVLDILVNCARAARLARAPAMGESEAAAVPLTLGVIRPLVILPANWRDWEEPKLGAVLVHELSHIAGRDYLRQILAALHRSVFWFSPLSWWLNGHLAELAEQVGDDSALLAVSDRVYYAEVLLGFFAALEGVRRRVCLHGVSMARSGRAARRLDRILAARSVLSPRLKKSAVVGMILGVMPLVYLMAALRPSVTQEPISLSASAPRPVSSPTRPEPERKGMAELSRLVQSTSAPQSVAPRIPNHTPPPSSEERSGIIGQEYRKIRAIEIVGSTSFLPDVLESRLKMARLDAWVVPEMVDADIELNLKTFLHEHGFLQSRVQWSLVQLEGREVALHMQVTEGPQYRLSDLVIKGVSAFAPEDISSQFKLHAGDILNLVEVKNALEKIQSMYADRGFIELSYIPERNLDEPKRTAALLFTFYEGIQYHVAYVAFVGCSDQAEEDRLRAQVDIHPGEIYSADKQKSVLATLNKFGVKKDTVEIVDKGRGLVGITFWLQSHQ